MKFFRNFNLKNFFNSNTRSNCKICKKTPKDLLILPCKCSIICLKHSVDLIGKKFNLKAKFTCKCCLKEFWLSDTGFEIKCLNFESDELSKCKCWQQATLKDRTEDVRKKQQVFISQMAIIIKDF